MTWDALVGNQIVPQICTSYDESTDRRNLNTDVFRFWAESHRKSPNGVRKDALGIRKHRA